MMKARQVAVLSQGRDLDGCGFHALYNASAVLAHLAYVGPASAAAGRDVGASLHRALHDRAAFGRARAAWAEALKAMAEREGDRYYPWTTRCVEAGVLERLHAEHLLEHEPDLVALGGKRAIVLLPELCLESLKNGLFGEAEAEAVQESIHAFRQPSVPAMAFLIGSLNHWVALVAHKQPDREQMTELCVPSFTLGLISPREEQKADISWYMDSRGYDITLCEHGEEERLDVAVRAYVEATQADRPSHSSASSEERQRAHIQSLRSTHFAVHLLIDCITGRSRFPDVAFGYAVEGIADCWLAFVAEEARKSRSRGTVIEIDASERRKASMLLVREWLRDYTSLAALERDVVTKIAARGGVAQLSPPTRAKLLLWLDDMLLDHCAIDGDIGADNDGNGDQGDDEIKLLAALLWPLRQQLLHVVT